jgi:hypothetical protein
MKQYNRPFTTLTLIELLTLEKVLRWVICGEEPNETGFFSTWEKSADGLVGALSPILHLEDSSATNYRVDMVR